MLLPGLIQRFRETGLTKTPRTPGVQDFLRVMNMGHCTWDHLLARNFGAIINHGTREANFFLTRILLCSAPNHLPPLKKHEIEIVCFPGEEDAYVMPSTAKGPGFES
jgi:hypothetical protein